MKSVALVAALLVTACGTELPAESLVENEKAKEKATVVEVESKPAKGCEQTETEEGIEIQCGNAEKPVVLKHGRDGRDGVDGIGEKGEKGDKGDKGDTGDRGPVGDVGPAGVAGPAGINGTDGQAAPALSVYSNAGTKLGTLNHIDRFYTWYLVLSDGTFGAVYSDGTLPAAMYLYSQANCQGEARLSYPAIESQITQLHYDKTNNRLIKASTRFESFAYVSSRNSLTGACVSSTGTHQKARQFEVYENPDVLNQYPLVNLYTQFD